MRGTRIAVAVAIATLTLTGCTSQPDGPEEGAGTEPATAGSAEATVTEDVLAEQTFDAPAGNENVGGTLTTAIRSLSVEGETMTLRWTMRWDNPDADDTEAVSLYDLGANNVPSITDPDNLKLYMPLCTQGQWQGGAVDRALCSNNLLVSPRDTVSFKLPNHKVVEAWAVFSAPEDAVDKVDVSLVDGWPAFAEVSVNGIEGGQ